MIKFTLICYAKIFVIAHSGFCLILIMIFLAWRSRWPNDGWSYALTQIRFPFDCALVLFDRQLDLFRKLICKQIAPFRILPPTQTPHRVIILAKRSQGSERDLPETGYSWPSSYFRTRGFSNSTTAMLPQRGLRGLELMVSRPLLGQGQVVV